MINPAGMSREELEAFVRAAGRGAGELPAGMDAAASPALATSEASSKTDTEPDEVSSATLERVYKERSQRVGSTATKAWAAGGGGGIGAAMAQILVLLLPRLEPAEVALSIILSAALGFVAAYWAPANKLTS